MLCWKLTSSAQKSYFIFRSSAGDGHKWCMCVSTWDCAERGPSWPLESKKNLAVSGTIEAVILPPLITVNSAGVTPHTKALQIPPKSCSALETFCHFFIRGHRRCVVISRGNPGRSDFSILIHMSEYSKESTEACVGLQNISWLTRKRPQFNLSLIRSTAASNWKNCVQDDYWIP